MCFKVPLFKVNQLNVIFDNDDLPPKIVLKDVNYTFYKQHFYIILGGNGVGKTTFVKSIISDLDVNMFDRYIHYEDRYLNGKDFIKKVNLGYIPQTPQEALVDSLTIGENFVFRGKFRNKKTIQSWLNSFLFSRKDKKEVESFISKYSFLEFLIGRLDEPFDTLSGGQQQLLNLAIILYDKPELIIMDEPTSKLDVEHKSKFWEVLSELHNDKSLNITFIITTHDQDLISSFDNHQNSAILRIEAHDIKPHETRKNDCE